jgi:Cu2+-exporting ATPase
MVLVGWNDEVIGAVGYADVPRPEAAEVLKQLGRRGIRRVVMVTGDHPLVARAVARQIGIDRFEAQTFPEQKTEIVRALQKEGYVVGVIGDGINDSPALAYADVSISLKGGTDVARETADVVLHGDLHGLVDAIDLARETMGLVRQNLAIVAVPNLAGLALATTGAIGPLAATAINNGSATAAAVNALRPLLSPGTNSVAVEHEDTREGRRGNENEKIEPGRIDDGSIEL